MPSSIDEQVFALPTLQSVRTVLEGVKLEREQAKEFPKMLAPPPQEEETGTIPVPHDDTSTRGPEAGNDRIPMGRSISTTAHEDENADKPSYEDTFPELRPNNPYSRLTPILDPDEFVGRANLMRRIYELLANGQSISLVGPHRIGKSSVLHYLITPEAQQKFPYGDRLQRYIFILKDLGEFLYDSNPPEGFFDALSAELISQSRERSLTLTLPEEAGPVRFSSALDKINAQGFYRVILLDEFDKMTRNPRFSFEFLSFLRVFATNGKASYVTASESPLYAITQRHIAGSPFFNIFYAYQLEAFTEEEALDLISPPAARTGMAFTPEEIAWVRKQAGLHPFFLRRVCYVLFEEKLRHGGKGVDLQDVRRLAYRELLPHMQDTWEHLTAAERNVLQDEAQQKENKQRALPELSESAFFRNFVRRICEVDLAHMSVEELEDALNVMNDPAVLGETTLRLMKVVTNRLNDEPTAAEKGKAIREVLYEAFEKLQGAGLRSDTAPDWLTYNILFYRYFRNHLKNNIIAGRLGFTSDRQYYRTRTRAIEALRNVLLQME